MEAKALADKLVEAGILYKADGLYSLEPPPSHVYCWVTANMTITDWRVAGKCLEYAYSTNALLFKACIDAIYKAGMKADELPRAIVEAFCEARQ